MTRRVVEIAIDKLIVDGVAPRDGAALRRTIEREVARKLAASEGGIGPNGPRQSAHVDAGTTTVSPTASPQPFGRAIAGRIAKGLAGGPKR